MRFLLRADKFFYRQAEYSVVLNPDKLNNECKKFIMNYMGDGSTEDHLHNKIKEFQCYRNKSATPRQKTFALMYSRFIDFPETVHYVKRYASSYFF